MVHVTVQPTTFYSNLQWTGYWIIYLIYNNYSYNTVTVVLDINQLTDSLL